MSVWMFEWVIVWMSYCLNELLFEWVIVWMSYCLNELLFEWVIVWISGYYLIQTIFGMYCRLIICQFDEITWQYV